MAEEFEKFRRIGSSTMTNTFWHRSTRLVKKYNYRWNNHRITRNRLLRFLGDDLQKNMFSVILMIVSYSFGRETWLFFSVWEIENEFFEEKNCSCKGCLLIQVISYDIVIILVFIINFLFIWNLIYKCI